MWGEAGVDDATEMAFEALLADWERQGSLTRDDVNRVLQRRRLIPSQAAAVIRELTDRGLLLDAVPEGPAAALSLASRPNTAGRDSHRYYLTGVDGLRDLLCRVGSVRLLNAEEEILLARRITAGLQAEQAVSEGALSPESATAIIEDARAAREHFIVANLRLAISVARQRQYQNQGLELDDLIQEAAIGLMRAVEKFDPDLGYKFSTYAMWWLRQCLDRAIAGQGRTIRLPVHVYEDVRRIARLVRHYEETRSYTPRAERLAQELDMEPGRVGFLLAISATVASLDAALEVEDFSLLDVVANDHASPEEIVIRDHYASEVDVVTRAQLTERELEVLRRRTGFGTKSEDGCDTLDAIGEDFGLTRERIRQIQNKALTKLRQSPLVRSLQVYLEAS